MIFTNHRRTLATSAGKALGWALAAAGIYALWKELPGIRRYIHITRIANGDPDAAPKLLSELDRAAFAQAPRRAGEPDRNTGRERRPSS